jgi:predicted ATPase with chaperone activity
MPDARTFGADALGLDGFVVSIEAVSGPGGASLAVVGQVEGALVESARRVAAALSSVGVELGRVLVHVRPAEHRKRSRALDLPLACAVLVSLGVVPAASLERVLVWGELGPGGETITCAGGLVAAETALREGFAAMLMPRGRADDAAVGVGIDRIDCIMVDSLAELIAHLRGEARLARSRGEPRATCARPGPALHDVRSPLARLAFEVMLAGGHHTAIHGPRGVELAGALACVPIELEPDDAITLTKIHDLVQPTPLLCMPSVRRVGPRTRVDALLGRRDPLRPGELCLAHRGVLVVERLDAWPGPLAAALREAVTAGQVVIGDVRVPARARLLATIDDASRGLGLLERFDLFVGSQSEACSAPSSTSEDEGDRLACAVARQRARFRALPVPWRFNADVPAMAERVFEPITPDAAALLASLAPHTRHRVRRVARTLADLSDHAALDEHALRVAGILCGGEPAPSSRGAGPLPRGTAPTADCLPRSQSW